MRRKSSLNMNKSDYTSVIVKPQLSNSLFSQDAVMDFKGISNNSAAERIMYRLIVYI
jgi:hypothetical protein